MIIAQERFISSKSLIFQNPSVIKHQGEWHIGKINLTNEPRFGIEKKSFLQGKIAKIFKGYDYQENQIIALKVAHQFIQNDPDLALNLQNEALVMKNLNHLGIPKIIDQITLENGSQVFAMESFEEKNLAQAILDKDNIYPDEVIKIVCDVASVIDYAASKKEFHGDIDPSQIIPRRKHTILVDWGSSFGADIVGKIYNPDFAAPERQINQIRNLQTEIFSLATVMYYILTENNIDISISSDLHPKATIKFQKISNENSKYSFDEKDIKRLNDIFEIALNKDPDKRYKSATDFADAFTEVMRNAKGINKSLAHQAHEFFKETFSL